MDGWTDGWTDGWMDGWMGRKAINISARYWPYLRPADCGGPDVLGDVISYVGMTNVVI